MGWKWIRFYTAPPRRGAAGRCVVSKYVQIIRYQTRPNKFLKQDKEYATKNEYEHVEKEKEGKPRRRQDEDERRQGYGAHGGPFRVVMSGYTAHFVARTGWTDERTGVAVVYMDG